MKKFGYVSCFIYLLVVSTALAQPNTEVYVLDIEVAPESFSFSNLVNVSSNNGYDNQPSFYAEDILIYGRTNVGNTDIAFTTLFEKNTSQWNNKWMFGTTPGGEYSPQRIPKNANIAAVRLDEDGTQRLYLYNAKGGMSERIFPELQVAYFAFNDTNTILGSVLAGDHLDLVIANLNTQKIDTLLTQVGRSIHKVPAVENTMSYTSLNEDKNFDVYQLDMKSKESFFVAQLPIGVQDMVWLDDSKLLIGSGSSLFLYDLFGNGDWKKVADLSEYQLKDITRLAVSPSGKQLTFVAEPIIKTPSDIVQAHILPFNERRLGDFSNAFSEDVVVRNFPKDTTLIGNQQLKASYEKYFAKVKSANVSVVNRLTHKKFVVDHEKAIIGKRTHMQATVYETDNDKITSMTFIANNKAKEAPTTIVDKQLEAYNARDIDAFMATYAQDIELFSFPNRLNSAGQLPMKLNYENFFTNATDLHCSIKNRIVIGNKVIDQEEVTANGNTFGAIAIYEIENGLIARVTFIQ